MSEEEIQKLKMSKAVDIEIETRSHPRFGEGGFWEVASRNQNSEGNSSPLVENPDNLFQSGEPDRQYPGINEHPGYMGIFVRKGS